MAMPPAAHTRLELGWTIGIFIQWEVRSEYFVFSDQLNYLKTEQAAGLVQLQTWLGTWLIWYGHQSWKKDFEMFILQLGLNKLRSGSMVDQLGERFIIATLLNILHHLSLPSSTMVFISPSIVYPIMDTKWSWSRFHLCWSPSL